MSGKDHCDFQKSVSHSPLLFSLSLLLVRSSVLVKTGTPKSRRSDPVPALSLAVWFGAGRVTAPCLSFLIYKLEETLSPENVSCHLPVSHFSRGCAGAQDTKTNHSPCPNRAGP